MNDQSHSSKFQDVLARMKAAKTASDDTSQTESSSMRVSAKDKITASTIQTPRDLGGVKPVQFSSIKKETIAPVADVAADMEAASEIERRRQEFQAAQIQSQIDSLLAADDKTINRIKNKGEKIINYLLARMIYIEGGSFMMGQDENYPFAFSMENNAPIHEVTLSSFYMGMMPVLLDEWNLLLEENMEDYDDPLHHSSFANVDEGRLEDVPVLCRRLSKITGCHFRLQTEAEHEYAARGGKYHEGYDYAGSDNLDFDLTFVCPKANKLGIRGMNIACHNRPDNSYDRIQSIAEWCSDYYAPYSANAQVNPRGPSNGTKHVFRSSDSPVWVRNFDSNQLYGIWREADWCIRLVCEDTPEAREAIQRAKKS